MQPQVFAFIRHRAQKPRVSFGQQRHGKFRCVAQRQEAVVAEEQAPQGGRRRLHHRLEGDRRAARGFRSSVPPVLEIVQYPQELPRPIPRGLLRALPRPRDDPDPLSHQRRPISHELRHSGSHHQMILDRGINVGSVVVPDPSSSGPTQTSFQQQLGSEREEQTAAEARSRPADARREPVVGGGVPVHVLSRRPRAQRAEHHRGVRLGQRQKAHHCPEHLLLPDPPARAPPHARHEQPQGPAGRVAGGVRAEQQEKEKTERLRGIDKIPIRPLRQTAQHEPALAHEQKGQQRAREQHQGGTKVVIGTEKWRGSSTGSLVQVVVLDFGNNRLRSKRVGCSHCGGASGFVGGRNLPAAGRVVGHSRKKALSTSRVLICRVLFAGNLLRARKSRGGRKGRGSTRSSRFVPRRHRLRQIWHENVGFRIRC
mmetsp:Transcript_4853/g.11948  ORF Transcript_4853/g.11948 Transcript_4853/m.11948 type:complete len:426 (+) Transcript_4853:937-2214(+)